MKKDNTTHRLTTDNPKGMLEMSINQCFVKNGEAWYRDFEREISVRDLMQKALAYHSASYRRYIENSESYDIDKDFDEFMTDNLQYDETDIDGLIAMYYNALCALAELHSRLKKYEDAEESGLLLNLPCEVGDMVWTAKCRYCSFVDSDEPEIGYVENFYINSKGISVTVYIDPDTHKELNLEDIFLTLEAAQQALLENKEV